MKTLPLTRGLFAILDDSDWEVQSRYKWQAANRRHMWYGIRSATRTINGTPKKRLLYLHREILQPPEGFFVDHANRNGLDCRRENLRIATPRLNHMNSIITRKTVSGLRGVFWSKDSRKWRAQISVGGKRKHLGLFNSKIEAALAYDAVSLETYGEFARLNFPNEASHDGR